MTFDTAPEPGLSTYRIRELATWYEEEAFLRRDGIEIDQSALDRDLKRLLVKHGVLPESVPIEFERVRKMVFPA
jgi:hypothetical protein